MEKQAEAFALSVVANAFDQAIENGRNMQTQTPGIFQEKLSKVRAQSPEETITIEDVISAAAAEHALAALFSNIQLTGISKIVLIKDDDTEIDLEEALNAPAFSYFNADGWLGKFAKAGLLAKTWQSGAT